MASRGDALLEVQAVAPLPSGADGTLRIAAVDQSAPPGAFAVGGVPAHHTNPSA